MTLDRSHISGVDLFCGVGGLTRGLSDAGIDVRLGVDIDPSCKHPFEHNNRARFLNSDVMLLDEEVISSAFVPGTVSLLAGCAPCQPFSTYSRSSANRLQAGGVTGRLDDWRLVERFGRLVESIKPDLVTMENVPPLLQSRVFSSFLRCLNGYHLDVRVVECDKIGLPQTRRRLVVLASRLGPVRIIDAEYKPETVRSTIGELPPIVAGEVSVSDPLHRASKLSSTNLERIRASKQGGTWRDWPVELRAKCHRKASGSTYPSVYGRMAWDEPSPTITTQCFGYGNGRFGHPEQDRAISLREAAMLQGFPRDYSFVPLGGEVSFSTLGRLIGNAVPVALGRVIGASLIEHVAALSGSHVLGADTAITPEQMGLN